MASQLVKELVPVRVREAFAEKTEAVQEPSGSLRSEMKAKTEAFNPTFVRLIAFALLALSLLLASIQSAAA